MIIELFQELFGAGKSANELGLTELLVRSAFVYATGLLIVRASESRFMGNATAFDAMLGFVLGSMLSRAINGGAPVAATIAGGVLLVTVHKALAMASFRWRGLGAVIKGQPRRLLRRGEPDRRSLRRANISEHDLREGLRIAGSTEDLAAVEEAVLERNGQISVVKKSGAAPRIVEIRVEHGVQTIRLELA